MKELFMGFLSVLGAAMCALAIGTIIYYCVRLFFKKKPKVDTMAIFADAYEGLKEIEDWYAAYKPEKWSWAIKMIGGMRDDLVLMEKDVQEKEK